MADCRVKEVWEDVISKSAWKASRKKISMHIIGLKIGFEGSTNTKKTSVDPLCPEYIQIRIILPIICFYIDMHSSLFQLMSTGKPRLTPKIFPYFFFFANV